MAEEPPKVGDEASAATEIRAFLIADVRGYTRFTQERGDEAAAELAKRFAKIAREGIEARGGSVIELRGDEALAVFGSPRQAIRAATELQDRFVEETISDPSLPLLVGIGLDAGEAVAVEGGYRGGALNLAARLCGQAGAGEVLASQEVVHLARRVDGVRYEDRGTVTLKGLSVPIHVTRVSSERGDASLRLAPYAPPPVAEVVAPRPGFPRSLLQGRGLIALLTSLAVIVAAISFTLIRSGGDASAIGRFNADSVGLIDLDSGSLLDSVDLGARPQGIAIGGGSVWVTLPTEGAVSRINQDTQSVVDTIDVGREPAGIAVDDGKVWVANSGDGTVSQVDVATGAVVAAIAVGNGPTGVTVGFGSVWVVNSVDGTLARIDPDKAKVTKTVYVGDGPTSVAAGEGAVWITNSAGATLSQVAPNTMTVETHSVGNGPGGVTVLPDGVWVANRLDGTVSRIDAETTAETSASVGRGPSGITSSGAAIWVANEFDGTISRIDISTREEETISVGNAPSALAAAGGKLWVTVRAAAPSHLGGTLVVSSENGPGERLAPTIDPAVGYDILAWQTLIMTNDGLVGFRKVAGAEGSLLVPDLATSLPRPTDGGTTYTFRVRPGIRYSTGAVVRPEDFRRGIERVYTTGARKDVGISFYDGIVGADRCKKEPSSCDLSDGIRTSNDTVSIRLKKPDPDFLYKLTLPFAYAVPARTGNEEAQEPLPATGPYMFDTYDPEEGFVLTRNPRFHEWSRVAQPAGYPDRIEWRYGIKDKEGIQQVLDGDLDWVYSGFGLSGIEGVSREAPQLLHSYTQTLDWYMSLGTTTPPFDDIRVRRAVNLAVDRTRVVELFGGADHARPTCQVLPPGLPGYESYCPYRLAGAGAEWTPDVAKAQNLIRRAGAKGARVEVSGFDVPGVGFKVTKYVTDVLNSLGLRATHKAYSNTGAYFDRLYSEKPQIGIAGWGQDYPVPSNFIGELLLCDAPFNTTGLCDSRLDRMVHRALKLQAVDPARARELWAEADRRIVDLAAWVPLVNPVGVDIVSERVGNYQYHTQWGVLLDQLWTK